MNSPLSLDFSLRHEVVGGHDVYWLGLDDDEVALVVDYARDDYRRASLVGKDDDSVRRFVEKFTSGFKIEPTIDVQRWRLKTEPGDAKFVYIVDHQDEQGVDWRVTKMGFGADPSIYLHLSPSTGRARLEERSLEARRNFVEAFTRAVLEPMSQTARALERIARRPQWLAHDVPLVTWFHPTELVAQGQPTWFEDHLVGISGLEVKATGESGNFTVYEVDRGSELLWVGGYCGALVIVSREFEETRISVVESLDSDAREIYSTRGTTSGHPMLGPSNDWLAFNIQTRSGPCAVVLRLDETDERELDDYWASSWGPDGLEVRNIDDQSWWLWTPEKLQEIPRPPRRVGPHVVETEAGFSTRNSVFEPPDSSSRRRMVTNVYTWISGPFVVADWSDSYLFNVETGQGWTLLPETIASRGAVTVDPSLTRLAFTTSGGRAFIGDVSPRFLNPTFEERPGMTRESCTEALRDSLAGDIFEFHGVPSHLSLEDLSRRFGLQVGDLRERLSKAGEDFVDSQVGHVRMILSENALHQIAALGVHYAAAWSILAEYLPQHQLLSALRHAAAKTFVDSLVQDEYLHRVLFGGIRPSADEWERVLETLHASESIWLADPSEGLETQLVQALHIVYELLDELKDMAIAPELWREMELRIDRLQQLMVNKAPAYQGLEELLEIVRCVEEAYS